MPKAIVFTEYGGPEVLRLDEVGLPAPGPHQVRVAVRAAGVNPVDWKRRRGKGFAEAGAPLAGPQRLGADVAGVVDAVGPDVTAFTAGDEVFGRAADGAYAEYAVCNAEDLVPKPPELPWQTAAVVAISAETAVRTLRELGIAEGAARGKTVLVHGASGGVGAIAAQLAVLWGAQVIGTAGPSGQELVRSFGAEAVEHGEGWAERVKALAPGGIDAVLDAPGKGVLPESVALTGDPAKVVTIADHRAAGLGVAYSRGMVHRLGMREVFGEVLPLLSSGRLRVVIGAEFPLHEAAAAHRLSESGHPGGRIVLLVDQRTPTGGQR
ncbi:NADP-dependent oxidoreductase [Amycolatopsis acidiphila]|uniref:NADP-dependent oxidoreductase n=1 Tax=Amycolatopsis acidiphila TaxID=715473 RepID=A0A558A8C2_9PSEU|nr:NADP-dependent oxidoreductase [Amycolatopsis acidiphila]TVT20501.1 NADP-dependent oxidoreductase [Amycolatopsis acidiphila]UIJ57026.1 NADP-dependent oxidoreductase [Amycolatopsis acidiphila]GHG53774.1 oxidoreductase [Amycolatopsis acidiphila]